MIKVQVLSHYAKSKKYAKHSLSFTMHSLFELSRLLRFIISKNKITRTWICVTWKGEARVTVVTKKRITDPVDRG